MSFIVKGIDLPTKGRIRIEIYTDGSIFEDKGVEWQAYPQGTAIQIPKGHGRIADVGGVRKELNEMLVEGETFVTAVEFAKLTIDDAPTILEAK